MKQICLLCNKKISFLGNLITTKHSGGVICSSCSTRVNDIVEMYGKNLSCYSIDQAKLISEKYDEMIVHVNYLDKIRQHYDNKIKGLMNEKKTCENDAAKDEKEIRRIKFEHDQSIKKIEDDYKEINGKYALDNLRLYLKYKSEGNYNNAQRMYNCFDKQTLFTIQHIEYELQDMEYLKTSFSRFLLGNKMYIEMFDSQIDIVKSMRYMELFSYKKLMLPNELQAFGFCGSVVENDLVRTENKVRDLISGLWDDYLDGIVLNKASKSDEELASFAIQYKKLIYPIQLDMIEKKCLYDVTLMDIEKSNKGKTLTNDSKYLAQIESELIKYEEELHKEKEMVIEADAKYQKNVSKLKEWMIQKYS